MRFRDAQIAAWQAGRVMICFVIPLACLADDPPQRTTQADGPPVKLQSPGQFCVEQVLNPLGQRLQSIGGGTVNLPRRSQLLRTYAPPRQVTLLGGDRVTAEVRSTDGERIELRLGNGQRTIVRRDAIANMSGPASERELLYEPFEHASSPTVVEDPLVQRPVVEFMNLDQRYAASGRSSLKLTADARPRQYTVRGSPMVASVQFWFRVEPPLQRDASDVVELEPQSLATALRVDFEFAGNDGKSHWTLRTTGNQIGVATERPGELAARQAVSLDQGWHCLIVSLQTDHATVSVDDSLLISTSHSPGRLQSIQFASDLVAWIDDLQIRQLVTGPEADAGRVSVDDDCVTLLNGDQIYGPVKQIDAASIILTRSGGDIVIPWSNVNRLTLKQASHAVAGAAAVATPVQLENTGAVAPILPERSSHWATIEFQSSFNFPTQAADRMQVAITRFDRDFLVASHPFLGEIAIGWNQVARVEPQFFGRSLTLDARVVHLGDSIREDFHRATPDGTQWSADFDLPAIIPTATEVWLSLDVADLEPSGPGTPPASPFFKELRSGRLLTQIKLNQESAGDINRWIHFRSSPRHPERVRCRLPVAALKEGPNKISLSQLPRKDSRTGFDNCELSNLRLELIQR